jgi:hypothetical protein
MVVVYNQLPDEVSDIGAMFSEGIFYGRIRTNAFKWDWGQETAGKTKNHWAVGIGGGMIFKSAYLYGFGMTAGLYTSQNPWHMTGDDYKYAKAGKDTFSRYEVALGGDYAMNVLAEAYLEYRFFKSSVRVGRQVFESLLTASNDTKMIPNTFQGISVESSDLENTRIKAAWFDRQKLRDHTSFHHVLAYGDDPGNPNASWTENDDSAMHKGLTMSKLDAAGIEDRLLVIEAENKSVPNLSVMVNFTDVPDLVGSAAGELNYTLSIGAGFKVIPGVRYLVQFDHGGGRIGGASLAGKITPTDSRGYRDPYSLDGSLFAARINMIKGAGSLLFGYSKVSDNADLVAPWRGFPTNGYTRAMGQYNWFATTETWMVQAGYDLAKSGLAPGFSVKAKWATQNFDDKKPDVQADSHVLNVDLLEKVGAVPGLEIKLRTGFVWGKSDTADMNGKIKEDPSYNEYRIEMNYLF